MTRLLPFLCVVALLWINPAHLVAPGEAGVAMGHVHLSLVTSRPADVSSRSAAHPCRRPVMLQFPGVFILLRHEPTGARWAADQSLGFNVKDIKAPSPGRQDFEPPGTSRRG